MPINTRRALACSLLPARVFLLPRARRRPGRAYSIVERLSTLRAPNKSKFAPQLPVFLTNIKPSEKWLQARHPQPLHAGPENR